MIMKENLEKWEAQFWTAVTYVMTWYSMVMFLLTFKSHVLFVFIKEIFSPQKSLDP